MIVRFIAASGKTLTVSVYGRSTGTLVGSYSASAVSGPSTLYSVDVGSLADGDYIAEAVDGTYRASEYWSVVDEVVYQSDSWPVPTFGIADFRELQGAAFLGVYAPAAVVNLSFPRLLSETVTQINVFRNNAYLQTVTPIPIVGTSRRIFHQYTLHASFVNGDDASFRWDISDGSGGWIFAFEQKCQVRTAWATPADVSLTIAPGIVSAENRVSSTLSVETYVNESLEITRYIVDQNQNPVDLTGKNLRLFIETKDESDIATVSSVTITGDDNNGFQLTIPSTATTIARTLRCALRDIDDGNRVWAVGEIKVVYAADAGS